MKKLLLGLLLSVNVDAYYIGGMYATLVSCKWGQHGYEYGYIGTYRGADNKYYQVFFGGNYCEY